MAGAGARKRGDGKGGTYAAPWTEVTGRDGDGNRILGPEYLPLSPRTGRAVAQSTAERQFSEGFGYVGSDGLWDHAEELADGSSTPAPTPERHDADAMRRYVELRGSELTAHLWEIYTRFWRERRSYAAVARLMGVTRISIGKSVLRLRKKLAAYGRVTPPPTGCVPCPQCQAQTKVVKTTHKASVTRRLRRCLECAHGFSTSERPE